jgi:hypothetical protein
MSCLGRVHDDFDKVKVFFVNCCGDRVDITKYIGNFFSDERFIRTWMYRFILAENVYVL